MTVIEAAFTRKAPADLADKLRALADAVDRGEVVNVLAVYLDADNYQFLRGASPTESMVMATLLQATVLRAFYEG